MPNWTSNEVTISGPADVIARVKDFVRSDDLVFDFDKIVPMPKDLCMESGSVEMYAINAAKTRKGSKARAKAIAAGHLPTRISLYKGRRDVPINTEEELVAVGRSYLSNKKKYGCYDWYDWCCDNWGTKWNACDCVLTNNSRQDIAYEFQTAWSDPEPVILRLSELFPDAMITLSSAYEDPDPWRWYSKDFQAGELVGTHDWIDQDLKDQYDEWAAEDEEEAG